MGNQGARAQMVPSRITGRFPPAGIFIDAVDVPPPVGLSLNGGLARPVGPGSGAKENRTPDLFHAMEALYQLSYSPVGGFTLREP